MTSSFKRLRDFIQKQMRMSHIYQPVMIRELLKGGGKASIQKIAGAFLARDESQLEYYEQITKNMPGKVLTKHGIVVRDGADYRLTTDLSLLSSQERNELVRLCDETISVYLEKRGAAVYDHRRAALGYLSGSLRSPGWSVNAPSSRATTKSPRRWITCSSGSKRSPASSTMAASA